MSDEQTEGGADMNAPSFDDLPAEFVIELRYPIVFGDDETITDVTVREPDFGKLLAADKIKDADKKALRLISIYTDLDEPRVKRLKQRDIQAIMVAVGKFAPDNGGPSTFLT